MLKHSLLRRDFLTNWDENERPTVYPPTPAMINALTFPVALAYSYYFAIYIRTPVRQQAIDFMTHAYCALAKRGQVTEEFCSKIINAVRDELDVVITMHTSTLNALYKGYMSGINDTNTEDVFVRLDNQIPDVALRLKLTLMQASGSGLTLFIIIGRAMRLYNDFP